MKELEYEPLVSIMMPVFNGENLISASLLSLLNQKYKNWECIIVNDGSTDNTLNIINEFREKDRRFKIINLQKNKGRAYARQTALDASKGKYVAMLDAEDLYHPDKLSCQVKFMEENTEISLISSSMLAFGLNTKQVRKEGYRKDEISQFNGENVPIHASSLLRKDLIKNIKYPFNLKLGEDSIFLSSYLKNNTIFYKTSQVLYYYSEFNSVTRRKILKTDITLFRYFIKQKQLKQVIVFFPKIMAKCLLLPFLSTHYILKRRGSEPNESEVKEFEKHIIPLINK